MAAIFAGPSDNRWGPEEWGGHPEVPKRTTLLVAGGKASSKRHRGRRAGHPNPWPEDLTALVTDRLLAG
ncbi:hypothetical protein [Streptomyces katrae]|uniref:hypothetical protein n=1 Tax=Streptomyces katrae TaxID=68223 RepID=UPI0012FE906C|nr:hypothetical protein [Streptomyces katrae]